MNIISNWIKNIVFYMILNTILMNLLGNSRYKKYISIVSGLILVMIVITPIVKILHLEDELDYNIRSNNFAVEAADFQNSLYRMEKSKQDAIFKEYREKVRGQVEDILKSQGLHLIEFDMVLNLDPESNNFGEITRMDIIATEKNVKDNELTDDWIVIEEINIPEINLKRESESKLPDKLLSPSEINVKIKLSDFYNIDADNINISIREV